MAHARRYHRSVLPATIDDVPAAVHGLLADVFAERRTATSVVADRIADLTDLVGDFVLGGGKRVRPTFAWAGFRLAGGRCDDAHADAAFRVCAALELIQACALIHDDIMDRSDTRRGRPTVHRAVAARHRENGWLGDPDHFGVSTAILLGDLALSWADDMLAQAPLEGTVRDGVVSVWTAMRTEVLAGQMLDVVTEAAADESVDAAYRVMRFKTAGYTVARPLQLGACLAGAPAEVVETLGRIGDGLGIAFQLRDDMLGVFGDPAVTGKPSGDDLVAGKRTALLAVALRRSDTDDPEAARRLRSLVGRPLDDDELDAARRILVDSGAAAEIETEIEVLVDDSLAVLDALDAPSDARADLAAVAHALTRRRS
ncbi:polyprenyl synthetase family protein [Williamsia deligens]|uniref:polyprenyl synthetase family protein n=1 Tax=Williamsia deligens TaxID=321325 RepID=UPI003CD08F92